MAPRHPSAPPPTPAQVRQAVDDIYARRVAAGDDDLHLWSDTPAEALAYVLRHQAVSRDVQVKDARDALLLIRAQRADLDALELRALDVCRRHQVPWSALAEDLGLSSPQAADQRRDRLRAAAAAQSRAVATEADPHERERAWTLANGGRIRAAAAALLRAVPDIDATGNAAAIDLMEDIELTLDGYRASHTQHVALLAQFRFLGQALGPAIRTVPAVCVAADLADEYRTSTG